MIDKKFEPIINDSQMQQHADVMPQIDGSTAQPNPAGIEKASLSGLIGPHDLFTLFTATIIGQNIPFTR